MLNGLDLFTGIGGITIALQDYIQPVAYCERDLYCIGVLLERMREQKITCAPICTDVRELWGGDCGKVDIIYGGFPCQDISVAGQGKGLAGERSGLFFEIIRLTKEIRPSFVFLENVPAIRTRGLEQVIKEFTKIGYDCRWTCLSASSVGAPHKRERWFLLAHANSIESRNKRKKEMSHNWQMDKRQDVFRNNGSKKQMAYTKSKRVQRLWSSGKQESFAHDEKELSLCKNKIFDKSRWEVEPEVGRVVDGLPFRVDRIKALGNAVVPLQVKTAFEYLIGIKKEQ